MDITVEGKSYSFPDDATLDEIDEATKPAKKLFSLEGVSSSLRSFGPSLARGILGAQLQGLEASQYSREQSRLAGKDFPVDQEEMDRLEMIREKTAALTFADEDISQIQGKQSYPLELATGAIQSVGEMLPGVASVVFGRNTVGAAGALPMLTQAKTMQGGRSYAEDRTPDAEGFQKGNIPDSQLNAEVQGTTEAAFELLPTSYLMKHLGNTGFSQFVKEYFLKELGTELPTTAAQDVSTWATTGQDMPIGEFLHKLGSDLVDTALTVPMAAGMTAGIGKGLQKAGDWSRGTGTDLTGGITPDNPAEELQARINAALDKAIAENEPPPAEWKWPTSANHPALNGGVPVDFDSDVEAMLASIDETTLDEASVTRAKGIVEADTLARAAASNPEAAASWAGLTAPDSPIVADPNSESGVSKKVANNDVNYPNPNVGNTLELPILHGPEGSEGKPLGAITRGAGTYTVGIPTGDRPPFFLKAVHDTIEQWRQEFMPNSTIVIGNVQLATARAVGGHQVLSDGTHFITPAVIRNGERGLAQHNSHSQIAAFYNLTHEFGHALVLEKFFEGVDPLIAATVRQEAIAGLVSYETIKLLPPGIQAIINDFNTIKAKVIKGQMSAQEFREQWMNPAKTHRETFFKDAGVAPTDTALALVKAIARGAGDYAANQTVRGKRAIQKETLQNYLGLDEYLAEQMTRHAYAKKWDAAGASPAATLFQNALQGMRDLLQKFFIAQKKAGNIKPGVAFSKWVEGISKANRPLAIAEIVKDNVESAGEELKKKVKKPKLKAVETRDLSDPLVLAEEYSKLDVSAASKAAVTALAKAVSEDYPFAEVPYKLKSVGKPGEYQYINSREEALKLLDSSRSMITGQDPALEALANRLGVPKKTKKVKVEKVQHNEETKSIDRQAHARKLLVGLIRDEMLTTKEQDYKDMQAAIRDNDIDTFIDLYQVYAGKTVRFELDDLPDGRKNLYAAVNIERAGITEAVANDPAVIAEAAEAWDRLGFYSPFVKQFFGDWTDPDATSVSKARIGAYNALVNGGPSQVMDGEPLTVFHATNFQGGDPVGGFEIFGKGDIGFHFGTVRAAMNRIISTSSPQELDLANWKIEQDSVNALQNAKDPLASPESKTPKYVGYHTLPAIINVRNPLDLGYEDGAWWYMPTEMLHMLVNRGTITREEYAEALANTLKISQLQYEQARAEIGFNTTPAEVEVIEQKYLDLAAQFAPARDLLVQKGYDGLIYQNKVEGDTSWVVFHPNQAKTLLGQKTFSKSSKHHMELDFDEATPTGHGAAKLYNSIKNFVTNPGSIRRALRRMQRAATGALQLQQMAHLHPELQEYSIFRDDSEACAQYSSRIQASSDRITGQWSRLGKENHARLNKVLLDEHAEGQHWFTLEKVGGKWGFSVNETTLAKMKEKGINLETTEGQIVLQMMLEVKNDLMFHLGETEKALTAAVRDRYEGRSVEVLYAALTPLKYQIHQLRKTPFFPQGRFGRYVITITEPKKEGIGRTVVYRESFESQKEWEEAWAKISANKAANQLVDKVKLVDNQYVLMALPTDFADTVASELALTDEQLEQLLLVMQPVKADRVLSRYELSKLGVKGFTADALRSYSDFAWHNANLLAKVTYRGRFNASIRSMRSRVLAARKSNEPGSAETVLDLQNHENYLKGVRDEIMAPANEAQMLRAMVAVSYLALNVKTAVINFSGLMFTAAGLTTEFGTMAGAKHFALGLQYMLQSVDVPVKMPEGIKSLRLKTIDLNSRREGNYLPEGLQKALDRALAEGVLSQSYAYHLAGVANQQNLHRLLVTQKVGQYSKTAVDIAMLAFRLTELGTRRVAFMANYSALEARGATPQEAYEGAVKATNSQQNSYSAGNKPPWMRGIKTVGGSKVIGSLVPMMTIFMSFAQHAAFHAYGGYELGKRRQVAFANLARAADLQDLSEMEKQVSPSILPSLSNPLGGYTFRIWMALLLLAGYEGLPGMENILDVLELMWRKMGGQKSLRQELRELIQTLGADPVMAARGLGHNVAGFDVSRSVGMGRLVPGTDTVSRAGPDTQKNLGNLVLDLAGPTGGFIKLGLDLFWSDKPMTETLRHFPGGLGNIVMAYHWSKDGVRAPNGALVTHDLQTGKLRDLTSEEIFGKALGFNPTIVSQNREILSAQYDARVYWTSRRKLLTDDVWRATIQNDREAIADAKKAVLKYNADLPKEPEYQKMKLTMAEVHRSIQAKKKEVRAQENGTTTNKRFRGIYQKLDESYDQP